MTSTAAGFGTGWMAALVALAVTLGVFAALWRWSLRKNDSSVVDLYWGFGFAVIGWIEMALRGRWTVLHGLFLALLTLWALRLGLHLARRHLAATAEDPRYAAMRDAHGPGWDRRSFWMVFMLQAAVMWLVATPVHAALAAPDSDRHVIAAVMAGLILFATGFGLEVVADARIARFKADPANEGKLLTTGLFAWSRHPNYFGESLLWWGFGLMAFGLSGAWWAFLGPAVLTWLLVKVSGVPPLEAHLASRPGFSAYASRTSAFVPLPPRRTTPDRADHAQAGPAG